ncbi:Gfo/Idh/MocA family oxidoreductase [Fulvimarina sp. 2208YS6-2-32]|uniref:Gfo/Idh/MocA family oxidoreductase n=1 Tax=Fulvimarina uroteuthidis TaxID=3098149 RepID=A0ABU5I3H4_9HYPH|nr:Gfo/Idh/MocA family oxidoreductase [Fulvimarina sp. 2208YS6-2-32]MDY8109645.1 Gfo/Idh/MocA family oxidoreductase [Fulvimarina sp. 2208YS6-2-32]
MAPNIAVIGCGQWGQNHVRTLAELQCLAAVADQDAERAGGFAEKHGVPALTLDEAIESDAIDAVILALPARLHGPTARRAFAAGKDVLIEKPIALDTAEAEATAKAAEEHGRLLMVGHVLRFHPVFRRLGELVAAGKIGTVRHLIANRLGLGRFLGMDVVWDLAPHDLSLILHLAGEHPDTIRAKRRTVLSDETDIADMSFTFPSGVTADVHVSRVSAYRDRRFVAIGTDGMLVFDDLAPENEKLAFYGHKVRPGERGFDFTQAAAEYMEYEAGLPLTQELLHFIDCIKTRKRPETGADEAVETVRILSEASPISAR